MKAFGKFEGGVLKYWPDDDGQWPLEKLRTEDAVTVDTSTGQLLFDAKRAHLVTPFTGERYSVVYYSIQQFVKASADVVAFLRGCGVQFPTEETRAYFSSLVAPPRGYTDYGGCQRSIREAFGYKEKRQVLYFPEPEKKRAKRGAGETRKQKQDKAKTKSKGLQPEVGFWIHLPALNGRGAAAYPLLSPSDIEHSKQFGEVMEIKASTNTCVVRFRGADQKIYTEQGRKKPGTALRRDVEFPLGFPFQSILTTKDAISPEDQFCVLASMKSDRQKHIRAQRRAEQKRTKAGDVS